MNQKLRYVLYNLIREKYKSLGYTLSDKQEKQHLLELCEALEFTVLKKQLEKNE
jgi:hypothetical protein